MGMGDKFGHLLCRDGEWGWERNFGTFFVEMGHGDGRCERRGGGTLGSDALIEGICEHCLESKVQTISATS
jgi:hypothetical protein